MSTSRLEELEAQGALFSGRPPKDWIPARLSWSTNRIRHFAVSRELQTRSLDSYGFWRLRDRLILGSWQTEHVVLGT